jgi:alpha-2-macroglobulin
MRLLALLLALLLGAAEARAQGFDLPGLSNDANAYAQQLRARAPAGGTPQQRAAAEQRAAQAERAGNWAAAATAWEERIALGDPRPEHWLALARAQLGRTPPDPARAISAAWNNFMMVPGGPPEAPSLALIGTALTRQDRMAEALSAFEAAAQRVPEDAGVQRQLAEARRAAGMLLRQARHDGESDPPRMCARFTVAPARRTDWRPADWVRAEPPVPDLAVTREGEELCVLGLPHGRTTRVVFRAGLPGEDGLSLRQDVSVNVPMPNRAPRLLFDNRAFLLPRGQPPRITLAHVNVDRVRLRVVRVSERVLRPFAQDWRPGESLDSWMAEDLAENTGRVLWEGTAELPRGPENTLRRSALPLPDSLRNAPPGLLVVVVQAQDGRSPRATTTLLPVFVTDLGLTAWRGADGLAVQARGFQDATPRAGVRIALMARNNDILAEAMTDATGLVRFAAPLLRGAGGLAPVALHAQAGDDLVALDLEAASFDLSDRGASGRPHPAALDAFLWTDRGIYRPGETVNLAALIRDAAGNPADIPARLRIRRPNGQVFLDTVPTRGAGAAIVLPVPLSAGAPAGLWSVELLADPAAPPIGTASFRVDAFVPERLAVEAGPAPGPLVAGTPLAIPLSARFLYGAPGEGLTGQAELRLRVEPEPFPAFRGFRFGVEGEIFEPDLLTFDIPATDRDGRTTLAVTLPRAPDTTRALTAEIAVALAEPGGRESRARLDVPVRARGPLVGIRPLFEGGAVNENAEAGFELALVSPEGRAIAGRLALRLVRERPEWRIVMRGRLARYETVWRDEAVDSTTLDLREGETARFARALPFGRYRLEASDGALGIASFRFRSGWAGAESAEVPDRVDVAADRASYAAGETARLRITPPFAGRASIAVLTDRLLSLREVEVAEGGTDVTLPVEAWGPGAYVAVTVFRPGERRDGQPARGLGLAWIALDPAARRIETSLDLPALLRPRQRVEALVRAAPGAQVTLAAVDEGVLRLTRFASPDPVAHFLGRRRLGVDIRDDYGRLIAPAEGEAAALRQGGDGDEDLAGVEPPQRVVSLFAGPVVAGADGIARIPLDLPDFAGELRLMAVAWEGPRIGAAARAVTVRDPLVAEALLPRFLAPGDEARLSVLLHNIELPAGEVSATLSTEGAISLGGASRLAATLATGERALPFTTLRASGQGEGVLRLSVTGPQGFALTREARITVRSARPLATSSVASEIAPGAEASLAPEAARFVPGSWSARVTWGAPVRYDMAAMLRALEEFPLACTEQSAARVLALAMVSDALAGPDRAARLQAAVNSVLDRQRFDGGFALWSAQGANEPWVTPFAAEALWRAREAGATVPEAAMTALLRHIEQEVEEEEGDSPLALAAQSYRLHVLGLAGRHRLGAARRLAENLGRLPTPLARAQLASAFARGGDRPRAEAAFAAALAAPARNPWWEDFGNARRDQLALAVLLRESGLLPDRLATLRTQLPGADFAAAMASTQDAAWAVAAGAALGRDGRPVSVVLDGVALPPAPTQGAPLSAAARVRNAGDAPLFQTVATTGLPAQALPAAREGLRVTRRFLTTDGQNLNLDQLRQNQVFLLLVEATSETGETHRAMLQQGLPAGWEIVGRLPSGEVPGLPFLGTLSEADSLPALHDRFAAAITLTRDQPQARFAVRVRAVTPGAFELPGAEAQDMYRPGIFARQNAGRITVLPAN